MKYRSTSVLCAIAYSVYCQETHLCATRKSYDLGFCVVTQLRNYIKLLSKRGKSHRLYGIATQHEAS
jgi:hypothetical protein